MQDLSHCPICYNKLKNRTFNQSVNRTCAKSAAHFFSLKSTNKKVEHIVVYLDNYTSLEVNFEKQCSFYYYEPTDPKMCLAIPKIMELDFPKLEKLKEKLSLYLLFT
jgi:uncharacterized protein (DUF2225 family)